MQYTYIYINLRNKQKFRAVRGLELLEDIPLSLFLLVTIQQGKPGGVRHMAAGVGMGWDGLGGGGGEAVVGGLCCRGI